MSTLVLLGILETGTEVIPVTRARSLPHNPWLFV
jgi:hypothetical protein